MRLVGVIGVIIVVAGGMPTNDRFRGDESPLRQAIKKFDRSRLNESAIWTHGTVAVAVLFYPRPHFPTLKDVRASPYRKDATPWRPAWINPLSMPGDAASKAAVMAGTIVLVLRTEDQRTCVVNRLSGSRILEEDAMQQDSTAKEMSCRDIGHEMDGLDLPPSMITEIQAYVNSPNPDGGAPPTH